mgnify:CR=1 FL=1|tara:strand:- start:2563 stop:3204 length:642 start_codon:yes stop_codon:yes gene_type:complete
MSDLGWVLARTGVSDSAVGTEAWTDPGNITIDDASNTTVALNSGPKETEYLKATNFNFSAAGLVATDQILGIEVKIERGQSVNFITDKSIKLVDSDGNVVGDEKSTGANWGNYPDIVQFGGSNDKWGLNPKAIEVLNSKWGVVFQAESNPTSSTASVDAIWMKITILRDLTPNINGTVTVGQGTIGTRFIDKRWPVEEGLIAGHTKQTRRPNL